MRKALYWLLGLAVLAGAGLSAFWVVYEPTARAAFEKTFADANAQGLKTSYSALEIGGFPLSYEGRFVDLAIESPQDGFAVRFPEARGAVSPLDPNGVDLIFPETFTLNARADGALTSVDVTSKNLRARVGLSDADAIEYRVTADTLRLAPTAALVDDHIAYEQPVLSGRLTRAPDGAPRALDAALSASGFSAHLAMLDGSGDVNSAAITATDVSGSIDAVNTKLEATLDIGSLLATTSGPEAFDSTVADVNVDLTVTPKTPFDFTALTVSAAPDGPFGAPFEKALALLAQGVLDGGTADLFMNTGAWRYALSPTDLSSAGGLPDAVEGRSRVALSGADGKSALAIGSDTLTMTSSASAMGVRFDQGDGAPPIEGAAALSTLDLAYPLRAAPGVVQPASISYQLADLTLEEATWAQFDPEGAMPRAMPGLQLDAMAGLELFRNFIEEETPTQLNATASPSPDVLATDEEWVALRTATIDTLKFEALGAVAEATGAFEFDGEQANGEIEAILRDWRPFLENLGRTTLLTPELAGYAAFTLDGFMQEIDENSSRITIELKDGAPIINGTRLGE